MKTQKESISLSESIVRQEYSRLAPIYDRRWQNYINKSLSFLLNFADLSSDASILDIACGTGEFARIILEENPQQQIMAILENDRNLIAASITTFFYSITDSYEPGLRSRDTAREIIDFVLGEEKESLKTDSRIHIRHEQANVDKYDELCDWLEQGKVQLLSLNDHLPPAGDNYKLNRHLNSLRRRHKMSDEELQELIQTALGNKEKGLEQIEELVTLAHKYNTAIVSHDDDTEAKVELSAKRGVSIAEFPATIELAAKSRDYGASVLMGAPNLIRGGSHVGWMSVEAAAKAGVVDCLCSDYHYPSLFHAPFKLAQMGIMDFEQAWKLVSASPAKAAGIGDVKGSIAAGWDADFILLKPNESYICTIASVYVGGKELAKF